MCQAVLGTGDMALQIEQMKLPIRVELPLWEGAVKNFFQNNKLVSEKTTTLTNKLFS